MAAAGGCRWRAASKPHVSLGWPKVGADAVLPVRSCPLCVVGARQVDGRRRGGPS